MGIFDFLKNKKEVKKNKKVTKIKDGLVQIFYKNNQLKQEYNYKNGKKDGVEKRYYEDGQLKSEKNYKNGKKDGVEKRYYEDGQLKSEKNYKNGKKDGVDTDYYENGQLKSEWNWKMGSIIGGESKKFNKDGELIDTKYYPDMKPTNKNDLSETCHILENDKEEIVHFMSYYKNGMPHIEAFEFSESFNPKVSSTIREQVLSKFSWGIYFVGEWYSSGQWKRIIIYDMEGNKEISWEWDEKRPEVNGFCQQWKQWKSGFTNKDLRLRFSHPEDPSPPPNILLVFDILQQQFGKEILKYKVRTDKNNYF